MATMTLTPDYYYSIKGSHQKITYSFSNLPEELNAGVHGQGYDTVIDIGCDQNRRAYNYKDDQCAVCVRFPLSNSFKGYFNSITFHCQLYHYNGDGMIVTLSTQAPPDYGWAAQYNDGYTAPLANEILSELILGDEGYGSITFNNINKYFNGQYLYVYMQYYYDYSSNERRGAQYTKGWVGGTNSLTYIPAYTLTINTIDNTSPNFSNSIEIKRTYTSANGSLGVLSNNANIFEGDKLSIIRTIDHGCYTSIATPADGNNYSVNGNITVQTTFSKEVYNINTELPEGISLTITKNGTSVNTCNYNDTLLISWNYNPSQNRRVEFINCTVNSGNLTNNNNQTYNYTVPDLNHNDTITFTAASKQIGGFWVKDSNNNWKIYDIYIMTNNGWKICDPYICTDIQNNTYTWKMLG